MQIKCKVLSGRHYCGKSWLSWGGWLAFRSVWTVPGHATLICKDKPTGGSGEVKQVNILKVILTCFLLCLILLWRLLLCAMYCSVVFWSALPYVTSEDLRFMSCMPSCHFFPGVITVNSTVTKISCHHCHRCYRNYVYFALRCVLPFCPIVIIVILDS